MVFALRAGKTAYWVGSLASTSRRGESHGRINNPSLASLVQATRYPHRHEELHLKVDFTAPPNTSREE